MINRKEYSPYINDGFTDYRGCTDTELKGLLAECDKSRCWETEAMAIFETTDGKYVGCVVTGCSCGNTSTWSEPRDAIDELEGFFEDAWFQWPEKLGRYEIRELISDGKKEAKKKKAW